MINTSEADERIFDVEFMNCVVDKADNLVIKECDEHFLNFVGIDATTVSSGGLFLYDLLMPKDREVIMRQLCRKNTDYIYFNFYIKKHNGDFIDVHATGQSYKDSTLCRLTLADVSRSIEKSKRLKAQAKEMNHLIDLVNGGVALFKVNPDMHFTALYLNETCCKILGTTKDKYKYQKARIDEFIHPEDRSRVFQAIGNSMATQKPISMELRIMAHKDEFFWCKMESAIHRYDNDGYPIFHALLTNINNVKKDEEKADRQSDLLVKLFKSLPGAMFYTSLNDPFKLEVVSTDFMKLIGYSRGELFEKLGGDLRRLISEENVTKVEEAIYASAHLREEVRTAYTIRTKKGEEITVVDKRKFVDDDNGEFHTIGILSNIASIHLDGDVDI